MEVVYGSAVWLKFTGVCDGATATAHEQRDSAFVQFSDRASPYVLPSAAVTKIEKQVSRLKRLFYLRLCRCALGNRLPASKAAFN